MAIVDQADSDLVSGFKWIIGGDGYVVANRMNMQVRLSRLIAGAGPDEAVDHANMNVLDNRSTNLRIASKSQNGANRGPDRRRAGRTSRYKGVCWYSPRSKWAAYIHVNGKTRYLGRFNSEEEAAAAYDAAALEAWGEFARLNNIGG